MQGCRWAKSSSLGGVLLILFLIAGCGDAFSSLASNMDGDFDTSDEEMETYFLDCSPQFGYQGNTVDISVNIIGQGDELKKQIADENVPFFVTDITFGEGIYYSKLSVKRNPPGFDIRVMITQNAEPGHHLVHAEFTAGAMKFAGEGSFYVLGQQNSESDRGGDYK